MNNLKSSYLETVVPKLVDEFKYKNPHQVPKLVKIHINSGLGLNGQNRVFIQKATDEIRAITGQHPILTMAKQSVAGFKVREGMPLGLSVTLRREKMYAFLERFIKVVLPRIRDFRGLNPNNFDKYGNYNMGISEQLVFPEINYDNIDKIRGMDICINTSASNKEDAKALLEVLNFPFKK